MGQDQAPAAVGGVADAAEVFPVQPIGEGAGFVGLDGEGRAHLSEGPQAAGSIAALFGKVLPNATPVTIEGPEIDPAGDTVTLTPAQLVAFARSLGVRDVCVAAFSGMIHALAPIMGALGKGDETTLGGFATDFMPMVWADEAHALIVAHPGLAPDALWLHLTARELFPRGAERFADLPLHEQYGFRLLIALHEAAWRVVSAALDEREEVVRAEAERQTPPRRVPLSDTIFERHGHVSDLIDGLKLNR